MKTLKSGGVGASPPPRARLRGGTHGRVGRGEAQPHRARGTLSIGVGRGRSRSFGRRSNAKGRLARSLSRPMLLLLLTPLHCTSALHSDTNETNCEEEKEKGGKRAHISNLQSNIIRRPPVGSLPLFPAHRSRRAKMTRWIHGRLRRRGRDWHPPRTAPVGRPTALSILTSICTKSELDRPIRLLFSPPLPIVSDSWMSREWENEDEGRPRKPRK